MAFDTVVIKRIESKGKVRREEYYAGIAGIYPGMLLKMNSAGKVVLHSTSAGVLGDEVLIAIEDYLEGSTVDTVYAINTKVQVGVPEKGAVMNLLIKDGEDIAIGDKIMSGAGGLLVEQSTPITVVGVAVGANDLSASANTANALSPVRIV